jgi:N-acyl-D-aspartate/D-glutamate deacylase
MYDLIIRNGKIVDGTGKPAFIGDLAIAEGRIAAVGLIDGDAARELDASGLLVTPGWVDVHSHMDGQATWDPWCSPALNHGITTLVMGNCGIGFAPCKADEASRDQLIAVVEDVEDIPGSALHEGVNWEWESFPQYLDLLDRVPHALDLAAQVPHCAVRTYVMGDRGVHNEPATAADVEQMAAIVREGIEAGALGFTTSRTELHTTRQNEAMPGTYADESELLGIGKVIGELGKGIYGLVSDWNNWQQEMDWMKRLSIENRCPVNFVLFFREESDWPRVQQQLEYVRQAATEGAQLIPHVGARPVNLLMGWEATIHPFSYHQNYAALSIMSPSRRLQQLRDPAVRQGILDEPLPQLGDAFMDTIISGYDKLYVLGDPPNYEPAPEDSIASRAAAAGITPQQFCYDAMMENDGKNLIYFPCFGYGANDLSRQVTLLEDENSVISLADTGAHCGVLSDVSVPTFLLSYLVRDRTRGKAFELEWAVKLHTRDTAQCVGLKDRGTLQPGMKADINIIDFETLNVRPPCHINDLPAGGRRIFQDAVGYRYTLVNGELVMQDGQATGATPGQLIRGAREAPRQSQSA